MLLFASTSFNWQFYPRWQPKQPRCLLWFINPLRAAPELICRGRGLVNLGSPPSDVGYSLQTRAGISARRSVTQAPSSAQHLFNHLHCKAGLAWKSCRPKVLLFWVFLVSLLQATPGSPSRDSGNTYRWKKRQNTCKEHSNLHKLAKLKDVYVVLAEQQNCCIRTIKSS